MTTAPDARPPALPRRFLLAMAALGLLAFSSGCVYDYSPYWEIAVRDDPLDENYLWGNLTWDADGGGISWAADPPNQPPGGPQLDPVQSAVAQQGYVASSAARRITGEDHVGLLPASDVFESEPLPNDLNLNVGRHIQLDLLLTQNDPGKDYEHSAMCLAWEVLAATTGPWCSYECPYALDVVLHAGDEHLAGAVAGHNIRGSAPQVPPGHFLCRYRMPVELTQLQEGTVLRLEILHTAQDAHFQYVLSGDQRSQIRLPFYPDDEWAFRDPAQNEGGPAPVVVAPPAAEESKMAVGAIGILGAAGLGIVGLASPVGGRRGRALLILLLLGATTFAGCLGGGGKPNADPDDVAGIVTNDFVQDLGLGGNGSILGQVRDDLHVAIPGAHVSVIGLDLFTDTDGRGRFKFQDLLPGLYPLRFEAVNYRVLESSVEVRPGASSMTDVTLFLKDDIPKSLRSHDHSLWGPDQTRLAMDHDVQPRCVREEAATAMLLLQNACEVTTEFALPPEDFNTVWPGTYDVEVTLSWDPAKVGLPRLGLLVQSNEDPNTEYFSGLAGEDQYHYTYGNWSEYYPREPNQPFHVRTTWEMQDPGHQRYSSWKFALLPPPSDYPGAVEAYQRNLWSLQEIPPVHVKIVLHKGVVPLEIPHPDHWDGATSLLVYQQEGTSPSGCNLELESGATHWGSAERVIPPETEWMEAVLDLTRDPGSPFALNYRTADQRPDEAEVLLAPEPTRPSSTQVVWKIPVKPEEPDDVYATKSFWSFATQATDATGYCESYYANALTFPDATLTVRAHRDPLL